MPLAVIALVAAVPPAIAPEADAKMSPPDVALPVANAPAALAMMVEPEPTALPNADEPAAPVLRITPLVAADP